MWKFQVHSLGDLTSDNIHTVDPRDMHGSGSYPGKVESLP